MKWLRTLILFDKGNVVTSNDWRTVHESYVRAIGGIDFPKGSGFFKIREKTRIAGTNQWNRNGVNYLRAYFLELMTTQEGWSTEGSVDLSRDRKQPPITLYPSMESYEEPITSKFGGFDFATTAPSGTRIAIEWETGNISSSHRSMNKLAIALANEIVEVGVLIVPSRKLYEHLTDRIGNIGELSGYLSMWESLKSGVERGLLAITVVEQDELTNDPSHPYLGTGDDGRAKEGRGKLEGGK